MVFGNHSIQEGVLQCTTVEDSNCSGGTLATNYSDRYDDSSAAWVMLCAILMFFMKAGFLFMEQAFSHQDGDLRRRVVLTKYVDTFASTIGFWLFGFAFSGNTPGYIVGEEQDYVFWFFRFTFASNTATILGGTLVGQNIQMRMVSVFIYAFLMSSFIHPSLARWMWSTGKNEKLVWSPYRFCNGTRTIERNHSYNSYPADEEFSEYIFFDFAGSGVVHLCGGMAALVLQILHRIERKITDGSCKKCDKYLKYQTENRRYDDQENIQQAYTHITSNSFLDWMYPTSGGKEYLDNASLGVLILWTTWFGFNAGSTESIEGKTTHATVGRIALVMALAAASGGLTCTIISSLIRLIKNHKANTNEIANGMLACLVAVTGCCPFIDPPWAILIGVSTVIFYHIGCLIIYMFDLYDGARIFPVHGICGFWGVLCAGIFSRKCLIKEVYEKTCFCTELHLPEKWKTKGIRILYQLGGGLFIATWSFLLCAILFLILWLIPVKCIMDNRFTQKYCHRERLNDFKGNMLFSHFYVPPRHTATLERQPLLNATMQTQ